MLDAFIGIDPGKAGAICVLIPKTKQVAFKKTTDNPGELHAWIKRIHREHILRVIMIEKVHAIQGTAAGTNFNFGFNTGLVTGIAMSTGASVDLVTPKKWQSYAGVKAKGPAIKKDVAGICQRLYPKVNVHGPRGGLLDGLSDSLMIAHYASHLYK